MAGVVDADTRIAESEAMWSYIDKETYPRRPILAKIPEDTWYKERNAFRLIDGEIFPKPAGKASFSLLRLLLRRRNPVGETSIFQCASLAILRLGSRIWTRWASTCR